MKKSIFFFFLIFMNESFFLPSQNPLIDYPLSKIEKKFNFIFHNSQHLITLFEAQILFPKSLIIFASEPLFSEFHFNFPEINNSFLNYYDLIFKNKIPNDENKKEVIKIAQVLENIYVPRLIYPITDQNLSFDVIVSRIQFFMSFNSKCFFECNLISKQFLNFSHLLIKCNFSLDILIDIFSSPNFFALHEDQVLYTINQFISNQGQKFLILLKFVEYEYLSNIAQQYFKNLIDIYQETFLIKQILNIDINKNLKNQKGSKRHELPYQFQPYPNFEFDISSKFL